MTCWPSLRFSSQLSHGGWVVSCFLVQYYSFLLGEILPVSSVQWTLLYYLSMCIRMHLPGPPVYLPLKGSKCVLSYSRRGVCSLLLYLSYWKGHTGHRRPAHNTDADLAESFFWVKHWSHQSRVGWHLWGPISSRWHYTLCHFPWGENPHMGLVVEFFYSTISMAKRMYWVVIWWN